MAILQMVGSLMWLATATRPDVSNTVRDVSLFSHNLSEWQWDSVKQILKYPVYTRTKGLRLGREGLELTLLAGTDFPRDESNKHPVTVAAVI